MGKGKRKGRRKGRRRGRKRKGRSGGKGRGGRGKGKDRGIPPNENTGYGPDPETCGLPFRKGTAVDCIVLKVIKLTKTV